MNLVIRRMETQDPAMMEVGFPAMGWDQPCWMSPKGRDSKAASGWTSPSDCTPGGGRAYDPAAIYQSLGVNP